MRSRELKFDPWKDRKKARMQNANVNFLYWAYMFSGPRIKLKEFSGAFESFKVFNFAISTR